MTDTQNSTLRTHSPHFWVPIQIHVAEYEVLKVSVNMGHFYGKLFYGIKK